MNSRTATEAVALEPTASCWDVPLSNATFAYFDLELTGPDPFVDELIEVSIARCEGPRLVETFSSLVRATRPSSAAAAAVHKIDDAAVARAPSLAQIAPHVARLFEGAVPVAHGVALDLAVLSRALEPLALEPPRFAIDTLVLARRALALSSSTLERVHAALGLHAEAGYPWHRAEGDMRAVREVFERLAPRFAPVSPRDLWEVGVGQLEHVTVRRALAETFARLAREGGTCTLVVRARSRDEQRMRGRVEAWTPPYVHLVSAHAPLRLVRGDRVLRVEH